MLKQIIILFIDDDQIGQALNEAIVSFHLDELCKAFSLDSISMIFAENIKEANIKLNASIEKNSFPSIIVSDIQMIDSTGFDFLQLFEDQFLKKYFKTIIALISANITEEDRKNIEKFPFAFGAFERPLNVKMLKTLIQNAIDS